MSTPFIPTAAKKRIEIIDIIRGFAVLGIFLSNVLIMSGYLFIPTENIKNLALSNIDHQLYIIGLYLVSGKFYPIFCILFGAAFYMQAKKFEAQGASFRKYMIKRYLILLLIGLFHQILWPGDVVTSYALIGLLLIPFRKINPKKYLILAIVSFSIYIIIGALQTFVFVDTENTKVAAEKIARFQFPGVDPHELLDKTQNGGLKGILFFNLQQYKLLWHINRVQLIFFQLLGLFFLGAYLMSSNFFTGAATKGRNLLIFFVVGALGNLLMYKVLYHFKIVDNIFFALFYISLLTIIYKKDIGKKILHFLSPLGRMALTNYILQSVFYIFIFHGLNLFATLSISFVYMIAFTVLIFQTIFSAIWLKKFQMGPFEWLWRKLTYKHLA